MQAANIAANTQHCRIRGGLPEVASCCRVHRTELCLEQAARCAPSGQPPGLQTPQQPWSQSLCQPCAEPPQQSGHPAINRGCLGRCFHVWQRRHLWQHGMLDSEQSRPHQQGVGEGEAVTAPWPRPGARIGVWSFRACKTLGRVATKTGMLGQGHPTCSWAACCCAFCTSSDCQDSRTSASCSSTCAQPGYHSEQGDGRLPDCGPQQLPCHRCMMLPQASVQ